MQGHLEYQEGAIQLIVHKETNIKAFSTWCKVQSLLLVVQNGETKGHVTSVREMNVSETSECAEIITGSHRLQTLIKNAHLKCSQECVLVPLQLIKNPWKAPKRLFKINVPATHNSIRNKTLGACCYRKLINCEVEGRVLLPLQSWLHSYNSTYRSVLFPEYHSNFPVLTTVFIKERHIVLFICL